jgi:hypothetical protein
MKEYVFLRIKDRFKDVFCNENLSSFLELYNRREESVFYKEQFRIFLEKNKQKEIICYLKDKLRNRDDLKIENNKIFISNKFNDSSESLELWDNYLKVNGSFDNSIFSKYLSEYDSTFLIIDINNNKIGRLSLVN